MYHCLRYPENPEIEKKINLFLDYFRFVSEHIGLIDDLPLENHLSLVEKIIFQIKHNPNHRVSYIGNYLTNPLLKDPFIKKFSTFAGLEPLIKEYNRSGEKKALSEVTLILKVISKSYKKNFPRELSKAPWMRSLTRYVVLIQ